MVTPVAGRTRRYAHKMYEGFLGSEPCYSVRRNMVQRTQPQPQHDRSDDHSRVRVRGAREHNLKNVDVEIPRDELVVFTGVSGSGKSSLAFGTLYAEAQRRYFESVAPYARRLIDQAGVPRCC